METDTAIWAGCAFKDVIGILYLFHPVDTLTLELQVNNQKPTPITEKHPVDGVLKIDRTIQEEYADYTVHFFNVKRGKLGDHKIKIILEG